MTSFTPGPLAVWPSLYEGYTASVVVDGSDPLRTLAQVREYRDAILYAAAPDMFDALTETTKALAYVADYAANGLDAMEIAGLRCYIDAGRAALAKAGGE